MCRDGSGASWIFVCGVKNCPSMKYLHTVVNQTITPSNVITIGSKINDGITCLLFIFLSL